jgi:hypothetical protein
VILATIFCAGFVKCEKEPMLCLPQVNRVGGFTFCSFNQISSADKDTTKIEVESSTFQGQEIKSDRISAILIASSDLESIPNVIFDSFAEITRLRIHSSSFNVIGKESFKLATGLKYLEFFNTTISEITPKAFKNAGELVEITFEDCQVQDIAEDAFVGLQKLKKIKITGSKFNNKDFLDNLPKSVKSIVK